MAGIPYMFVRYEDVGIAGYYILRMGLTLFLIGFFMFGLMRKICLVLGLALREPEQSDVFVRHDL